jgi:helix-turn-helix protein
MNAHDVARLDTMPLDDWLLTREVAALLEIDDSRVRQLRLAGRLKGRQLTPRQWVFDKSEVERFRRSWDRSPGRKPATRRRSK